MFSSHTNFIFSAYIQLKLLSLVIMHYHITKYKIKVRVYLLKWLPQVLHTHCNKGHFASTPSVPKYKGSWINVTLSSIINLDILPVQIYSTRKRHIRSIFLIYGDGETK